MSDPISICVTGSDGSGKSTQIARLTEILNRQSISVSAVSVWDAFTDPAILEKVPLADPAAIYGYLKLLGPSSRPHFLYHALHMALELAQERRPDVLLLNGYWYKYFASEVAHGANPTVARSLTAAFPQPNWTFHLTVRPEDALRRKPHRSDYESGYADDPRMFLEFQRRTQQILAELGRELGWIDIDGRMPAEDITAVMIDELEEGGVGCGG
jgi:thymidylate kinase